MKTQEILDNIKKVVAVLPTEGEKQFGTHVLAYKAILEKLDGIEEELKVIRAGIEEKGK